MKTKAGKIQDYVQVREQESEHVNCKNTCNYWSKNASKQIFIERASRKGIKMWTNCKSVSVWKLQSKQANCKNTFKYKS